MTMEWNKMVPELTVSNFKLSIDFYINTLGFKVVNQRTKPNFAYIDLNGAQIMLEEAHANGWETAPLEKPFGRGVNFQIEVENVQSIYSAVIDKSIKPFRQMSETWYKVSESEEDGQKEFLVKDPDGYLLRLSEPLGKRNIL